MRRMRKTTKKVSPKEIKCAIRVMQLPFRDFEVIMPETPTCMKAYSSSAAHLQHIRVRFQIDTFC